MYSLVYRSLASENFEITDIYVMLSLAKEANYQNKITGCLLYHNNKFVQLLEGNQGIVTELYSKILRDERHHSVELISATPSQKRLFPDWSMAFHDYGQNGASAHLKLAQIDNIFKQSEALNYRNQTVFKFFSEVNEVLFKKAH